ncbi:protein of unassigned function [Methylobacterium oryzae CBMB20]|uniref:Protein of unassigned function n=1 Tax=Methylobacterium oryzae CBMB20 TaxID=693986 RepID=A0A089NQL5_9HYPH|nr:protein of unassigned function [Methylobacterium oryzae CBMB20]
MTDPIRALRGRTLSERTRRRPAPPAPRDGRQPAADRRH